MVLLDLLPAVPGGVDVQDDPVQLSGEGVHFWGAESQDNSGEVLEQGGE